LSWSVTLVSLCDFVDAPAFVAAPTTTAAIAAAAASVATTQYLRFIRSPFVLESSAPF
jgi:hypothetical protein